MYRILLAIFLIAGTVNAKEYGKVYEAKTDGDLDTWLRKAKEQNVVTLLKFDMAGCQYCTQMDPVVRAVAEKNKDVLVIKVRKETCPLLVKKLNITKFPTFYVPHTRRMWSGVCSKGTIEMEIRTKVVSSGDLIKRFFRND